MSGGKAACPICGGHETQERAPYLFSSSSHREWLNCRSLRLCRPCGLGFAEPVPSLETLRGFYANIYRKGWLNPYRYNFPEWETPSVQVESQMDFLDRHLDWNGIRSVGEIGCGYGFLLRAIRQRHPKVKLYAFDDDLGASGYLRRHGVAINPRELPAVDLCLSSHCLEHFTEPRAFFDQVTRLKPSRLFLEVPNCDGLSDLFLERAYDSPHLLFFSAASLARAAQTAGWTPLEVDTAGYSLKEEMSLLARQKETLNELETISAARKAWRVAKDAGKRTAKRLVPEAALKGYRALKGRQSTDDVLSRDWFAYGGPRAVVRGMFGRKEGDDSVR